MPMTEAPNKAAETAGTPRWVKVFGIITLVVIMLAVVLLVTGRGGPHSPRRHISPGETTPAGGTGGHTGLPPGVTHTRP
jgi:hypothetical protein